MTSYGGIVQTTSLKPDLFWHILYEQDNFYCINAEDIIVL